MKQKCSHELSVRQNGKRFCKTCSNEAKRLAYKKNPKKFLVRSKANRAKDKAQGKKRKLSDRSKRRINERKLIRMGITPAHRSERFEEQKGLCAVCEQPKRLVDDHDHRTGMHRGLLCKECNSGIGLIGDNHPSRLRRAAKYLEDNTCFSTKDIVDGFGIMLDGTKVKVS